jgi:ABC-2 type transport system permease protein
MIGILLLIILVSGIGVKLEATHGTNTQWKTHLLENNKDYKKMVEMPFISDSEKNRFEGYLKINEYEIKNNKPPIANNSLWGYINITSEAIMVISFFTIVIGSRVVADEFSQGTIKLLLVRPYKRYEILLSKYIAVVAYAFFMLLLLFVFSFLLGGILFGIKGASEPFIKYSKGSVIEVNMVAHILGLYGLKCIDLVMMATLAFMISTVFRSSSIATGVGVFLLTIGSTITKFFSSSDYSWPKYILFANTDLTQYINGAPMVAGMTLEFSIIMILVYFISFMMLAFLVFIKRDI